MTEQARDTEALIRDQIAKHPVLLYMKGTPQFPQCGLGHSHPAIAEAIAEQAATLVHTSNLFEIPWQTAAAQKLAEVSGMEEIFFSNSGAESNEG
ncbi:aminotransferase class III-fold pyridoxal phosphate-dependent enzyme, partial [Acinetobacter baumannii]